MGVLISYDAAGKVVAESHTFTCGHCNRVVEVPARGSASGVAGPPPDLGGFCRRCMHNVCGPCCDQGACTPFLKRVERAEKRHAMLRSILGALVLAALLPFAAHAQASPGAPVPVIGVNQPGVPQTLSASCASGVSCAANTTATIALFGMQTATAVITAVSSPVGISDVADCSFDGTNWVLGPNPASGGLVSFCNAGGCYPIVQNPVVGSTYTLVPGPGCVGAQKFQIRNAALISGSITAQLFGGVGETGNLNFLSGVPWQFGPQPASRSLSFVFSPDQVLLGPPAASTAQNTITLTTTTETTIIAALGPGLFSDLTFLSCFNATSTATEVDVRDATGGTVRWPGYLSATAGAGFVVPFNPSSPWRSQATNANWTVKLSAAVGGSGVLCSAQAIQR